MDLYHHHRSLQYVPVPSPNPTSDPNPNPNLCPNSQTVDGNDPLCFPFKRER